MTDYRISKKSNKGFARSSTGKWQGVLAFFVVVFLVFALLSGFIRSALVKKKVADSSWDNVSSFVLGLKDNQNSLFIFQKDPKRAVFIKTGLLGENINAEAFSKRASIVFGTDVKNYFNLGNLSDSEIRKKFEDFTKLVTPIKILTTGWASGSKDTNIVRIDALKLWWQLKAIRSKDLQFINLSSFNTIEKGKASDKVLGVTSDLLNHEISTYLENTKLIQEDMDISIVNASDDDRTLPLAENFISSVGGRVVSVAGDTANRSKCSIVTNVKSSYTVKYLARVFVCDINDASQTDDKPSATIYLGQDFPSRYFE